MKQHLKKHLIPILLVIAAAIAFFYFKKYPCFSCHQDGVIIKTQPIPNTREMQQKFFRAKQVAAAVQANGHMPRLA